MISQPTLFSTVWRGGNSLLLPLLFALASQGVANETPTRRVPVSGGGAAINQAIAELGAEGGEIQLERGTYVCKAPVVIARNKVVLRGAGPGTRLKLAANANCPVIVVGDIANKPRHEVSGICVADLSIDGNRTEQRGECWNGKCDTGELTAIRSSGLVIRRARDILVVRVSAMRCRSGGLVTEKHCRRLTVQHFEAGENEFDGLACYETEDSVFTELVLNDNKSAGISTDIRFDHNRITNSVMQRNGSHGIFMRDSHHNDFENIVIANSGRAAVFLDQVDDRKKTGSSGNHFTGLRVIKSKGPAFQVNADSCKNTVLASSVFEGNKQGLSEASEGLVKREQLVVR